MNTIELKNSLHRLIDGINDSNVLQAVHTLLSKKEEEDDFWDSIPDEIHEALNRSLAQSERGEVIPHEEVMKNYEKWL